MLSCSISFAFLLLSLQSPVVSRAAAHHHHQQHYHDKKFDLLSDLGGDIFAAPANPHAGSSANFANFAHFNSHPSKNAFNTFKGLAAGVYDCSLNTKALYIKALMILLLMWKSLPTAMRLDLSIKV